MESFFHSLKVEDANNNYEHLTHEEVRLKLFEYIEVFYNRVRMHSYLDYLSPYEFENKKRA